MSDPLALEAVVRLTRQVHGDSTPESVLALMTSELRELLPHAVVELADADHPNGDGGFALTLETDAPVTKTVLLDADGQGLSDADRRRAKRIVEAGGAVLTALHTRELSRLDTVTSLLSRGALRQALDEEVARSHRTGDLLACALFDLDGFKAVNDELGHLAGDAVLREVGAVLGTSARPYDRVARFGGDEFVILMPGTDATDAETVADRLRNRIRERTSAVVGRPVGCSAGVGMLVPGASPEALLDAADAGLRAAKRSGGGRIVITDAEEHTPVPVTHGVRRDLDAVLHCRGVTTVFQPIMTLDGNRLVAFEALSRGPGALERPDHLLAEARAAGELIAVDERLRAASFEAAREQGLRAPVSLFVNIEPETLIALADDDDLWPRVPLPFPSVTEITERALFANPGRLLRACSGLRARGWGIALDDVGTDPRALALLPLLAPDVIKLDLRALRERPPAELAELLHAVSAQVEHGGAMVLGEGIETAEHTETAAGLGATLGQGYLLGRPGPLDAGAIVGHAVPRVARSIGLEGITPFGVISSQAPERTVDEALVAELQVTLERRALSAGPLAVIASAVPQAYASDGVSTRFEQLRRELGLASLIGSGELADDDPVGEEWTTAVVCADLAVAFSARPAPGRAGRWRLAIAHDMTTGRHIAEQLLVAHETAPRRSDPHG